MSRQQGRTLKDYLVVSVKGLAMGAADIVPGVSGGTVALITGIYSELLHSLQLLTPAALLVLIKEGPVAFWEHINGNFLLALFLGILISIKTLATGVSWALEHQPLLVWGGFSGLIVASLYVLYRQQSTWRWQQVCYFLFGAVFVVFIALAKPADVPGTWWMLFLGGFIAICAMILPGISGSFILLLIGLYPVFVGAIESLDLLALGSFGLGCICGLLVFSRFLSWLLDRFYANTLAVMLGFLLGSLYVTWPWKVVVETAVNRHGKEIPIVQQNVLPALYESATGIASQWGLVSLCFCVGIALVLMVEFLSSKD